MAYNINSFGYDISFLNLIEPNKKKLYYTLVYKLNYDLQIMQTYKQNGYK